MLLCIKIFEKPGTESGKRLHFPLKIFFGALFYYVQQSVYLYAVIVKISFFQTVNYPFLLSSKAKMELPSSFYVIWIFVLIQLSICNMHS